MNGLIFPVLFLLLVKVVFIKCFLVRAVVVGQEANGNRPQPLVLSKPCLLWLKSQCTIRESEPSMVLPTLLLEPTQHFVVYYSSVQNERVPLKMR